MDSGPESPGCGARIISGRCWPAGRALLAPQTEVPQFHLNPHLVKQQRSLMPISKCTFLICSIMLLFNKLFTPCFSDEDSRGLERGC